MLPIAHKTPLIDFGTSEEKRAEIKKYFNDTFDLYEKLFSCLKNSSTFYLRPEPLRHPLIFYFGHTATFFINKLIVANLINQRVDEKMESMLAVGVDEMSWDDLNEIHYDWPSVEAVKTYRDQVRDIVNHKIDTLPLNVPIRWEDPFWIILMGIEHERIHLETSSVLIRQLPIDQVSSDSFWKVCDQIEISAPQNELIPVEGKKVRLGRDWNSYSTYGWDNEFGRKIEEVEDFKASRYLVSNYEFLAFVEDGGYESEKWWEEEGWQWNQFKKPKHPTFWKKNSNSQYVYRTMLSEIAMPWSWPVDVNYHEAKAFCNWLSAKKGISLRLPTEAEWYVLASGNCQQTQHQWRTAPGNLNLEHFASSCPVNQFKQGEFFDIIGNVWQWTETPIDAFEGFAAHPSYDDFSVPTFDGRHNLIKGGSWISTGNEALLESRYAFRRHFFQHAGFRYVESTSEITRSFDVYETDQQISMYLEFHYGDEYFGVENFPRKCVEELVKRTNLKSISKALDLGCAVGRSSFELSRYSEHVDAIDFSTRFIRNAIQLKDHHSVRYFIQTEGELNLLREIKLSQFEFAKTADRVNFSQGDACNLKTNLTGYDLVFAGNLVDRLYDPQKFLLDIQCRINTGGFLVLTSPYTWLPEFTEKAKWLGGFKEHGESLTSLQGISRILNEHFEIVGSPIDIPFVIRETSRKFQHTISQMTIWKKK